MQSEGFQKEICLWWFLSDINIIGQIHFFPVRQMLTLHLDSKLTHDIIFGMNISIHWKV